MDNFNIELREDGMLNYHSDQNGSEPQIVQARYCFPWSSPKHFITLRNLEGEEVQLIEDLNTLPDPIHQAIESSINNSAFVFIVEKILKLETEFEIRNWLVETKQGEIKFQMKIDDWPRETPEGGLLFRDVSGDLYLIPQPHQLDAKSKKLIWGFLD